MKSIMIAARALLPRKSPVEKLKENGYRRAFSIDRSVKSSSISSFPYWIATLCDFVRSAPAFGWMWVRVNNICLLLPVCFHKFIKFFGITFIRISISLCKSLLVGIPSSIIYFSYMLHVIFFFLYKENNLRNVQ